MWLLFIIFVSTDSTDKSQFTFHADVGILHPAWLCLGIFVIVFLVFIAPEPGIYSREQLLSLLSRAATLNRRQRCPQVFEKTCATTQKNVKSHVF